MGAVLKLHLGMGYRAKDPSLIPGLGRSLEEGMATHASILAWRIPWTEEPGGLQSMGSPRVGRDRAADTHFHTGGTVHVHLTCSWKEGGALWGAEGGVSGQCTWL